MDFLHIATVIMAAAVLVVSISKKMGFGSILGYIFAGVAIGPWGLSIIKDTESILRFSEIGVILLLFIIGLGLRPSRLWLLRKSMFGLGFTQVCVTTLILTVIAQFFIGSWATAFIVGFGLSLSSTAFALQILSERKELSSPHGRSALKILLFQDLAVIPVLALIPLFGIDSVSNASGNVVDFLKVLAVLTSFWLFSRFLLRPILRAVAGVNTYEIFTAASLLLVLGSALIMDSIGISMALGGFLAGVLVADSEYRHQLEADIEPFKGLLLGLFFIAVGMSANLGLLIEQTLAVVLIALFLIIIKGVLLFLLGHITKLTSTESSRLGISLSQGGEFGFILFGLATEQNLMTPDLKDLLIVAATLSMALTPVILFLNDKTLTSSKISHDESAHDAIDEGESKIILAGFGRFGQIIARILRSQNLRFTAIENDSNNVEFVRELGNQVYFGNACNLKLLNSAHINEANIFIIAISNVDESVKIAELITRDHANIKLFARAKTRMHEMRLRRAGVDVIIRDTLMSSIYLAEQILVHIGMDKENAALVKNNFFNHDATILEKQFAYCGDPKALMQISKESYQEEVITKQYWNTPNKPKPDSNES